MSSRSHVNKVLFQMKTYDTLITTLITRAMAHIYQKKRRRVELMLIARHFREINYLLHQVKITDIQSEIVKLIGLLPANQIAVILSCM